MSRPQPEQFATRAEYRWADKNWRRKHGGALWSTLVLAVAFGLLSGSAAVLVGFIALALVGTAIARSRP